jgi:membrane protein DedA with SNARE-associated domain
MPLASITAQLTDAIAQHGVLVVALVMAVDAVLPAGGEVTMLFAGALASGALAHHTTLLGMPISDGLDAYVVLSLAGTIGYVAGSAAGWLVGRRGGPVLVARYGRWLHVGPERMARAERWFQHFGTRAVFLGRLTPLVRSFVSIPAGVLNSPPGAYFASTIAASLLWCFGFAGAGWALGTRYDTLHQSLRFLDVAGAALLVAALVAALWQWRRARPAT